MTQQMTFKELFLPETPGGTEFVPWPGIAVGVPSGVRSGEGFRPVFAVSPIEEECRKLTDGVERQRAEALAEIEHKDAALNVRMADLDRREEEFARLKEDLDANTVRVEAEAAALATLADDFAEMKKARWTDHADEIVAFALELADKIVKERVHSDPTLIVGHLRAVLEELRVEEAVAIYLAPDDLAAFQSSAAPEVRSLLEHPHITWLGDVRLKRGEIHVDTSQFRLDASVMTAMKNLREDMMARDKAARDEEKQ